MQYCVALCSALLCSALLCSALFCSALLAGRKRGLRVRWFGEYMDAKKWYTADGRGWRRTYVVGVDVGGVVSVLEVVIYIVLLKLEWQLENEKYFITGNAVSFLDTVRSCIQDVSNEVLQAVSSEMMLNN
ncbi:hypothetical protein M0802_013391 [Mischocyttarus mexicanus]|nr:hypothetical protein M0802_013391 [Mischocyttarus mexicanus]